MQLYGLIGELGAETKISIGFSDFTVASLDTNTLFADILAAKAGEVVREKDSRPDQTAPLRTQSSRDLADTVQEKAESLYREPKKVILDSEQEPAVRELLEKLGFDQEEIEETLETAQDQATGGIRLDCILKAIKNHLQGQNAEGILALPAGSSPEILILAEKMGLDNNGLKELAQALGSGTISLTDLVSALKETGTATKSLGQDDLTGVKELLVKAGLSQEKAERLIEEYADGEGGLSMDGLIALLEDIIQENDKVANLVSSGKLTEMLAGLMEGAKVEVAAQPEAALHTESLLNQLNRLEADQKRELNIKKNAGDTTLQVLAEAGEEPEEGTLMTLKDLEALLFKGGKGVTAENSASTKISAQAVSQVEVDPEGIEEVPAQGANASQDAEKMALAAKATLSKTGSAEILQTRTSSPQRGADQVNLSTTATTQTVQSQEVGAAARTGQARMTPSVMLEQLSGRMMLMVRNGQSSVKLQLYPQELGSLKIELKVDGNSVKATIVAENQQVQQMLGSNSSELRQSLADQGFNLDKFEVMTQSEYQQANSNNRGNQDGSGDQQDPEGVAANLEEETSLSEEYLASAGKYYRTGQLDLVA